MTWRFPWSPRIAVVELTGIIGANLQVGEYTHLLASLRDSRRIRAVMLQIDSPGGTVAASEALRIATSKLAARKPVVAFIQGSGTSGAYLVSCAATKIVAFPSAILGSIGVIATHPVLEELLSRLGLRMAVTKSGPYKDMGAFYREPTEEEQRKEAELIDHFFQQFVDTVASSRHLDREHVRNSATGEIFSATKALELGLVDELGDMDRALDLAAELARVPKRVVYVRPRRSLWQRLIGTLSTSMAEAVIAEVEARLALRLLA